MKSEEPIKISLKVVVFILIILMFLLGILAYKIISIKKNINEVIVSEENVLEIVNEVIEEDYEYDNQEIEEDYEYDNQEIEKDIIENELVAKLYLYISSVGVSEISSYLSYPAHNSNKGTLKSLGEDDMIYIAYNILLNENIKYNEYNIEILNSKNVEKIYDQKYLNEFSEGGYRTYYTDDKGEFCLRFSKDTVLSKIKEIFGDNININNYNQLINSMTCYKDGYYYSSASVESTISDLYTWGYETDYLYNNDVERFQTEGFSKYIRYEENNDEIYIYEYYLCRSADDVITISKGVNDYFPSSCFLKTSNNDISTKFEYTKEEYYNLYNYNKWIDSLKEKAGLYKHTFKKDRIGNYCWVESELINK